MLLLRMGGNDALSPEEQTLISAATRLTAQLDLARAADATLQAVDEMFAARCSWLLLLDPAARTLVSRATHGAVDCFTDARIKIDTGVIGRCFAARETLFIPDVRAEDGWANPAAVRASGLKSAFVTPLMEDDEPIGVLGLDAPRFTPSCPPSAADIARLRALAGHAAIGIRNARLFESIERERERLGRLLEKRRQLKTQVQQLRFQMHDGQTRARIIGTSAALKPVLKQIGLVATADSTVLIHGETGTGKELVARVIHAESRRRANPFVALNCAALPESLVESELFGYERGAFTGALARKLGKFELADRGTLFLDEVGDLPLQAQAKLLRVLQEREVQRVGGTRPVPVNVRMIAATNKDLERERELARFRTDLFYRLSVFPIRVPPLRERKDDIAKLVEHFIRCFAERVHKPVETLSDAALDRLLEYDWPGNVRELQNIVERAVILANGAIIGADAISIRRSSTPRRRSTDVTATPTHAAPMALDEAERRAILRACTATGWRISGAQGAAQLLGLKPTTLHAKMKRLGIRRPAPAAGRVAKGGVDAPSGSPSEASD